MKEDKGEISDGYHTFNELYDHRITLFIALCRIISAREHVLDMPSVCWCHPRTEVVKESTITVHDFPWRSKRHSDGELCFGTGTQFIMGIGRDHGKQVTYHIPIERWDEANFAETLDKSPEWDGHTSADVLERLKSL